MGMIDDIATVTNCGIDSIISNSVTNTFIESKRLMLGPNKSHRLHIGNKKQNCANLKVHGNDMSDSTQEKYVGDIITVDGKNDKNIAARKARGFAIAGDILSILEEVPLGPYRIEAGLCMRNAMFLNSVLTNSEVWYGLTEKDYTDLEKVDEYLLRKILNAHSKTPIEALYLETGSLPIRFVIKKRRISYLYHLLTRDTDELISKFYFAQKRKPVKDDWALTVKYDMIDIDLGLNEEI